MFTNLWYCAQMNQWRWTITDGRRPILKQEAGQCSDLHIALMTIEKSICDMTATSPI
jgi:hypothetical protein